MPQRRSGRRARPLPAMMDRDPRSHHLPVELADMLGGLTDREDLARLYDRKVDLPTIVRLMGRKIPRDTIRELIQSPDPGSEARRLLD